MAECVPLKESRKVELKRDLTKIESYATIIGILVGSGIFVVTGRSGAIAGPSVPLAYLVLAPIMLVTGVAYSVYLSTPLGTRPGGEYLHISRTTLIVVIIVKPLRQRNRFREKTSTSKRKSL